MSWTPARIPDLTGKRAIVTGATSGLGLATAVELARHGADVTLGARNAARGQAALERIRAEVPDASIDVADLDVASLESVATFAKAWTGSLDLLINNAGIMGGPFQVSPDGFELQIATNHLGHFALTGHLLPALLATGGSRVVSVSSAAARQKRMLTTDLRTPEGYDQWQAYARSKFANLLFAAELDRRLKAAGATTISVAAHPGLAKTNLFTGVTGPMSGAVKFMGQSPEHGAWPQLRAATDPKAKGGQYYAPRFIQIRGRAKAVPFDKAPLDEVAGAGMWALSEASTGVTYLDGLHEGGISSV